MARVWLASTDVVHGVSDPDVTVVPSPACRRDPRRPPRDPSKWISKTKETRSGRRRHCARSGRLVRGDAGIGEPGHAARDDPRFAQKTMDAEVEAACGAGYGEVSPQRVNSRNGYRAREWDTRAGTVELDRAYLLVFGSGSWK